MNNSHKRYEDDDKAPRKKIGLLLFKVLYQNESSLFYQDFIRILFHFLHNDSFKFMGKLFDVRFKHFYQLFLFCIFLTFFYN